ncbi:MAG: GNAT family N-acetyltransferase [Oscillospiraceae bacterium]|nr:GNAT family N-acetyltransferase [Oscillospiraceae bacterium]
MKNEYFTVKLTKEIQAELSQSFDCGNPALTTFLKSYEALDDFFGVTYVIKSKNGIIGYYNISTGHIENENHIRMGGTIYINCLAIDKLYQKKKFRTSYYSDILMNDCLQRIENLRNKVGFAFVTLSSTDEGYHLYERNGFCELEDDMQMAKNTGEDTCIPMYLPLDYEE